MNKYLMKKRKIIKMKKLLYRILFDLDCKIYI